MSLGIYTFHLITIYFTYGRVQGRGGPAPSTRHGGRCMGICFALWSAASARRLALRACSAGESGGRLLGSVYFVWLHF